MLLNYQYAVYNWGLLVYNTQKYYYEILHINDIWRRYTQCIIKCIDLQHYMVKYNIIWVYTTIYEFLPQYMSLFNNYRVYTTLYEYIRQYMSLYNNIWVYTTVYEYCIYNNIWVHTTIFEFIGWYTIVVLQMSTLIVIVLIFDRFRSDRFVCLICLLIHATKKNLQNFSSNFLS